MKFLWEHYTEMLLTWFMVSFPATSGSAGAWEEDAGVGGPLPTLLRQLYKCHAILKPLAKDM